MTHPSKPTSPTSWEDRLVFREIFLLQVPPLGAEALRELGRVLYDGLLEVGLREPAEEPWVRSRVRAVAEDLRLSGQVLASLAEAPRQARLTPEEDALAIKAGSWAREISELVEALEAAVGRVGGER